MAIPELKNEKWIKVDAQTAMQTADVTRSKIHNLPGVDAKIAELEAELAEMQRVRAAVVAAVGGE